MSISAVRAWFNSDQPYNEGLEILKRHTANTFLIKVLSGGPDDYNTEKLRDELQKVLDSSVAEVKPAVTGIYSADDFDHLPEQIKELIGQIKIIYKENGARHAQLSLVKTDRERALLAHQILDADDQARLLLYKVDYYKAHKKLPDITPEQTADIYANRGDVMQQILNLRTFISRAKKKKQTDKVTQMSQELERLTNLHDSMI